MVLLMRFEPTKPWFLAKYVCQFRHSGIENRKLKHQKVRVVRLRLDYMNIIKHRRLFPLDKDVLSDAQIRDFFVVYLSSSQSTLSHLSFILLGMLCIAPIKQGSCQMRLTLPSPYRVDFISGTHHLNRHHL